VGSIEKKVKERGEPTVEHPFKTELCEKLVNKERTTRQKRAFKKGNCRGKKKENKKEGPGLEGIQKRGYCN